MTGRTKGSTLVCDIETFSSADLARTGVAKYTEAEDFEILLMSYAFDDDPVQVWDFTKDGTPDWLAAVLVDPDVLKVAWNISFERTCFNKALGIYTPPEQWRDAMTLSAMCGLPMSLEGAGEALQLSEKKLTTGKALINYFCKPCRPTLTNGMRTRNHPEHALDKWEQFIEYCARDTETERTIYKRLCSFPVPDWERRVEWLDARINERGVLADIELAESAVYIDETVGAQNKAELQELTGLDNPNSVSQLKDWLETVGVSCESLNKATVVDLKKEVTDPTTRRVLELRQLLGKTSVKKYQAILDSVCADNRIRGMIQYYGAGRTGRFSGRRVQLQNLARNELNGIAIARELVREHDLDTIELMYGNVPNVLSQLIRTALIAKPGHKLVISDYSSIEAKVLAYLAGEKWRMDVFAQGKDIYCISASQIFGVPVEKNGVNKHLRSQGKVAELACGYNGGVSAMRAMDIGHALDHLSDDEVKDIVTTWRQKSPAIPKFWRDTEKAVKTALRYPGRTTSVPCGIKYRRDADALRCILPSGRMLSYWGARLDLDGNIVFMGQNQMTRKWEQTSSYGGKLVENAVQAFARDVLALAMLRLEEAGYDIVFSVHDEIIAEEPIDGRTWEDMAEVMGQPIDWAPGLVLGSAGFETPFYMKD